MGLDFKTILSYASAAATVAGKFGVPFAGLGGTILSEANAVVDKVAQTTGQTREQVVAAVLAEDAENLAELTADQLKGE